MKVNEIAAIIDAEILCGKDKKELEIDSAFGSDMMSDVLAFVNDRAVLLTGLVNAQVVRTAEMMDMPCIVFVRGKKPTEEMVELANERGIVLLATALRMYEACGKLYAAGLPARRDAGEHNA